ncbi:hypothetical protein FGO68_gene9664 [Halteria grandinella]|uniref:Uncharacterized protein n=1 Tax=Halteria grandinella TaxID=5974 RepID=A0A8J8NIL3_HALGN|nr:hypothetical protein FGO68_gene9664 [Halteria grandinella]
MYWLLERFIIILRSIQKKNRAHGIFRGRLDCGWLRASKVQLKSGPFSWPLCQLEQRASRNYKVHTLQQKAQQDSLRLHRQGPRPGWRPTPDVQ